MRVWSGPWQYGLFLEAMCWRLSLHHKPPSLNHFDLTSVSQCNWKGYKGPTQVGFCNWCVSSRENGHVSWRPIQNVWTWNIHRTIQWVLGNFLIIVIWERLTRKLCFLGVLSYCCRVQAVTVFVHDHAHGAFSNLGGFKEMMCLILWQNLDADFFNAELWNLWP